MRITKTAIEEIDKALTSYKHDIDEMSESIDRDITKAYTELSAHKNDYTAEYMAKKKEDARRSIIANHKPSYDRLHKAVSDRCDFYTSALYRQIRQHYAGGCRSEYISRLQIYREFDIDPSVTEIEILAGEASNYAEKQALRGLVNQLKNKGQAQSVDNPYRIGEDKSDIDRSQYNPYVNLNYEALGLDEINLEQAFKTLDEYKEKVRLVVDHYCSKNESVYELTGHGGYVFDVSPDEFNHYVLGGSDYVPEKRKNDNFTMFGVNATAFWESPARLELEKTIDRLNQISERRSKLTASEKTLLNSLFGEIPSYALKNSVREACDQLPQIASLVELSEKYGKYLDDDAS